MCSCNSGSTIQQEIYAKLILGFSLPDMSGADSSFFWEVNRLNLQSQAQPTMEQKASWTRTLHNRFSSRLAFVAPMRGVRSKCRGRWSELRKFHVIASTWRCSWLQLQLTVIDCEVPCDFVLIQRKELAQHTTPIATKISSSQPFFFCARRKFHPVSDWVSQWNHIAKPILRPFW